MAGKNPNSKRTVPVNGALIISCRKAKGLSQEELADEAHVSKNSVAKMEKGENVSLTVAKLVAVALDLTFEQITDLTSPAPAQQRAPQKVCSVTIDEYDNGKVFVTTWVDVVADKQDTNGHARRLFESITRRFGFDKYDPDDVSGFDGSLIIIVPLKRRDASKLVNAFLRGELAHFNVVSMAISTSAPLLSPYFVIDQFGKANTAKGSESDVAFLTLKKRIATGSVDAVNELIAHFAPFAHKETVAGLLLADSDKLQSDRKERIIQNVWNTVFRRYPALSGIDSVSQFLKVLSVTCVVEAVRHISGPSQKVDEITISGTDVT